MMPQQPRSPSSTTVNVQHTLQQILSLHPTEDKQTDSEKAYLAYWRAKQEAPSIADLSDVPSAELPRSASGVPEGLLLRKTEKVRDELESSEELRREFVGFSRYGGAVFGKRESSFSLSIRPFSQVWSLMETDYNDTEPQVQDQQSGIDKEALLAEYEADKTALQEAIANKTEAVKQALAWDAEVERLQVSMRDKLMVMGLGKVVD